MLLGSCAEKSSANVPAGQQFRVNAEFQQEAWPSGYATKLVAAGPIQRLIPNVLWRSADRTLFRFRHHEDSRVRSIRGCNHNNRL
jgi:hypothetical protein